MFFYVINQKLIIKLIFIILAFVPFKMIYDFNFCSSIETKFLKYLSKNVCDTESMIYRNVYAKREIEVIIQKFPTGTGPGLSVYNLKNNKINSVLYPNQKNYSKIKLREIYSDILSDNHENHNLTPPQSSNWYGLILMNYGLFGLLLFIVIIHKVFRYSDVIFVKENRMYLASVMFFILNFIFNSTTGLALILIIIISFIIPIKDTYSEN